MGLMRAGETTSLNEAETREMKDGGERILGGTKTAIPAALLLF